MSTQKQTSLESRIITDYERYVPDESCHGIQSVPDQDTVTDLVAEIIQVESPIHKEVIYQRGLDCVGHILGSQVGINKDLVVEVINGIDKACSILSDKGIIEQVTDVFYIQSGTSSWEDSRNPRVADGRSVEHILLWELVSASSVVSRKIRSDRSDDLVKHLAEALGIARLDGVSRERLLLAVQKSLERDAMQDRERSLKHNPQLSEQPLVRLGYDVVQDISSRRLFLKDTAVRQYTVEGVNNMLEAIAGMLRDSNTDSDVQLQIVVSDIEYVGRLAP